ncbi:DUF3037 domain-containing protein [Chryseolinea sp. T2]|uniref:DUF3037 domain-containing protein n=1 Tax=Chryseolinea sp. T2 TaxID=3129255 RepID=UPI00307880BA
MQERSVFEYAVIRIVPKVERLEFFNVGVILYCGPQKFLGTRIQVNREKLKAFGDVDCDELDGYIMAFERISAGGKTGGPIGELPIAERFRWLTATRSTIVQTSHVHPGLCLDAEEMLDSLFRQLVL